MVFKTRCIVICLCLFIGFSCKKAPPTPGKPGTPGDPPAAADTSPAAASSAPQLRSIVSQIDGKLALQQAHALCNLGARNYDSPGHAQARSFLIQQLKNYGWSSVEQNFETDTPAGKRTYTNIIATRATDHKPAARILLAAHYDAPGSSVVTFPAASSGAAGCGVLLEMAQRLSAFPAWAAQVELVFFDGEEPVQQISPTDGLAGSRFFIHTLVESQQAKTISALIVYGAIGHSNAHWTLPMMTPNELSQDLRTFALEQKWEAQITNLTRPSWGAHLPALQAGIPSIFLNDALYPSQGTADDSGDQLAVESLRRATMAGIEIISNALHEAAKPN